MMVATFNGNPSATIISFYSPTNVSEETELIPFYIELSSLFRGIPKHKVLVIGGDMVKTWTRNLAYTTRQTEMDNIKQILWLKID